jgi:CheY-like chemotaxis protein
MRSDEDVIRALQAALRQLYDTQALRANPLVEAFGLTDAPHAASQLRQLITEAIRALRPAGDVPPEAGAWRLHEILEYRYLQQVGQIEVARQLGLSVRHLRREERRAAEVLAQQLCPRLVSLSSGDAPSAGEVDLAVGEGALEELAWLDDHVTVCEVNIGAMLGEVIGVAQHLAQARGIAVQLNLPKQSVSVTMQPVALREMILELLTAAICHAAASPVTVTARPANGAALIEIGAALAEPTRKSGQACTDAIAMARHLAVRCGALLQATVQESAFLAVVSLPPPQGVPVLVIEDNEDTVRLLRRYVAGTPFHISAAERLPQALEVAARTHPKIIVLDVMMPHVDGWEVLAHLRQNPLTSGAPIVVCSILTQEELAFSLGASEYIRKPVSAQTFILALERALRQAGPEQP